jgi:hypothetical protein
MAAKDYEICCALFDAYIAKVSKRDRCLMTDDRRAITESEILGLIDWYIDKELKDGANSISFPSMMRDGEEVVLGYRKKE